MGNKPLLWKMILCLTLVVLLAVGPSCVVQPETRPRAWIDVPKDGAQVGVDTPVVVTFHAYAQEGVAEIALSVNGEQYTRKPAPQPGEQFIEITQEWVPAAPGEYVLQVRAYDAKGGVSNPASIRVEVVPAVSLRITTPTVEAFPPAPAEEPSPPPPTPPAAVDTATRVATGVPPTPVPPTATAVPPTPVPPTFTPTTPPPPTIVSFEADPPAIDQGDCTRLSWVVQGVISAVWFDGEGVGDHDSRDRCPDETTTYNLRAVGLGGEVTETATVVVTEDRDGPDIGSVQHSPNVAYCSQLETIDISAEVSDPSGVSSVELYCTIEGEAEDYCGDFTGNGDNWTISYDPKLRNHCPSSTTLVPVTYRIKATDDSPRRNESWWGTGSFNVGM